MMCPFCSIAPAPGTDVCPACESLCVEVATSVSFEAEAPRPAAEPAFPDLDYDEGSHTMRFDRPLVREAESAPADPAAPPSGVCMVHGRALAEPIVLEPGSFYRIGRESQNEIHLPSARVSRLHADLVFERGAWVIEDLGSTNGTYVNGERVERRALKDGDRIGIWRFELVFRGTPRADAERGAAAGFPARAS